MQLWGNAKLHVIQELRQIFRKIVEEDQVVVDRFNHAEVSELADCLRDVSGAKKIVQAYYRLGFPQYLRFDLPAWRQLFGVDSLLDTQVAADRALRGEFLQEPEGDTNTDYPAEWFVVIKPDKIMWSPALNNPPALSPLSVYGALWAGSRNMLFNFHRGTFGRRLRWIYSGGQPGGDVEQSDYAFGEELFGDN